MKVIDKDLTITINLQELVWIRASFLQEELNEDQVDYIAEILRRTLTWDSLYGMVDQTIWDFVDPQHLNPENPNPVYGEISPPPGLEAKLNQIEKNKKQFEMVDLVSPSWTIQVPRRIR